MKVFDDKGVAIHIDPKPCIDAREGIGEAWVSSEAPTRSRRRKAIRESASSQVLNRHSIPEQGRWLGQVVRDHFAYHAVPTNRAALAALRFQVMRHWRHALSRSSNGTTSRGTSWVALSVNGCHKFAFFTPGSRRVSSPTTQGKSRVRELRTLGSSRGARSNACPTAIHQIPS